MVGGGCPHVWLLTNTCLVFVTANNSYPLLCGLAFCLLQWLDCCRCRYVFCLQLLFYLCCSNNIFPTISVAVLCFLHWILWQPQPVCPCWTCTSLVSGKLQLSAGVRCCLLVPCGIWHSFHLVVMPFLTFHFGFLCMMAWVSLMLSLQNLTFFSFGSNVFLNLSFWLSLYDGICFSFAGFNMVSLMLICTNRCALALSIVLNVSASTNLLSANRFAMATDMWHVTMLRLSNRVIQCSDTTLLCPCGSYLITWLPVSTSSLGSDDVTGCGSIDSWSAAHDGSMVSIIMPTSMVAMSTQVLDM